MKVFSFDAETNGLYGEAFCLAAVVIDEAGNEVANFVGRCPIAGAVDGWVAENVLPNLEAIEVTHADYGSLLEGFYAFYKEHKVDATVIAHMAHPVETKVLRDLVEVDLGGRMWDGPYPLIDVAGVLLAKGFNPTSVDTYNTGHGVTVPFDGATHHPLYDSWAAAVAFRHLMGL